MKILCFKSPIFLLIFLLYLDVVHTRHHKASKKTNYHRRPGIEKASRANLLWGLILARNTAYRKNFLTKHSHETKQQHQNHSYKRQQRLHLNNANEDVYSVPLNVGLCSDEDSMCVSYALNGLCDWPGLLQNLGNIHETCKLSCGLCKENIPDGEVDLVGAGWNEP
ncbi:hypothetical protein ABFA07_004831 [Porites harrisoni]